MNITGRAWCETCGETTTCKGSGRMGKSGAFCANCRGEVKCPHPNVLRREFIGSKREPGQCAWCGKKMP